MSLFETFDDGVVPADIVPTIDDGVVPADIVPTSSPSEEISLESILRDYPTPHYNLDVIYPTRQTVCEFIA